MSARAEAGSPPSATSMRKYQVFLSFRGKDTRKKFTDHLYAALLQAQIHTFKDEHALERGRNIGNELQKAIKESEITLVVLSRNYAESKWCLDELVGMMENTGLLVIPIFYDLQPSDVRSQTGSFAEAFSEHEKCESKEKVDSWRAALRQVADLGGMVLQNEVDGIYRYEAKFIQEIVQHVKTNLTQNPNSNLVLKPTQLVRFLLSGIVRILLAILSILKYLIVLFFRILNYSTKPRSIILNFIGFMLATKLENATVIILFTISTVVGYLRLWVFPY